MKILKLEIEGYKSLKHVVWEPGDLNVLIGPNGSGKSNLLRLLEMLSASANNRLSDFLRSERGLGYLLWDGRADGIKISLRAQVGEADQRSPALDYAVTIKPIGESMQHTVAEEKCDSEIGGEPNRLLTLTLDKESRRALIKFPHGAEAGERTHFAEPFLTETVLSRVRYMGAEADDPLMLLAKGLMAIGCYHGFDSDYDSAIRGPMMTRFERDLMADGKNLINFLHTHYTENKKFRKDLDDVMRAAFGSALDEIIFTPAADQYIQMRVRWKDLEWAQPPGVLSDGILRFFYLAAILLAPNLPSVLAIDEPEIGFHPSIFPIIAELAARASERTQVVLTTHSPEFLNAFEDVQPTVTIFEWHDGETEMRNLSDENLKYWLEKYKLGELFRTGGLEAID